MSRRHGHSTTAPLFGGTCPCGKLRYPSRRAAKDAARRMRGQGVAGPHLNPYRCGDFWHLGNLPRAVVTGDVPRADIHRPTPDAPRRSKETR